MSLKDYTVIGLQNKRDELCQKIAELIREFEKDTEIPITNITLDSIDITTHINPARYLPIVRISIKL